LRQSLVRDLQSGLDKVDVAVRHGVSVETVTWVLGTEIGLRAAWAAARTGLARQTARGLRPPRSLAVASDVGSGSRC